MVVTLPAGFRSYVANIGVKDTTDDFTLVVAESTCAAAGVFTQSRFAGPSVIVSRKHIADNTARAMVVISKNANVANGPQGLADAIEVVAGVADSIGCNPYDVLVASTGVIGRPYPMDRIRRGLANIPKTIDGTDAESVARGIMTTDTVHKIAEASVAGSAARVVGVAKGVGMIEPNMATLITMMFTDANIAPARLDEIFRRVIDRTFNCVSVDTDTSTSDTAVILASGVAGAVDEAAFESALYEVAL
ncbi:MAG: bifunctional ornithine acetyltransferase/N-acetylglutamate synthase, partial [Ilumatobacteraceae bacterium]